MVKCRAFFLGQMSGYFFGLDVAPLFWVKSHAVWGGVQVNEMEGYPKKLIFISISVTILIRILRVPPFSLT